MEVKPITIYARDGLYIKSKRLDDEQKDDLKRKFTKEFYNKEKVCERCEYFDQRPCDVCDSCANYGGRVTLARDVVVDETRFFRLPYGGIHKVRKILGKVKVVDETSSPGMVKPIKFTRKLRPDQVLARDAIITARHGILKSPPRSGKCIVGSSLVMTDKGLHPIRELFEDYSLSKRDETIIDTSTSIATYKGARDVSYLYSKIVDQTVRIKTQQGYGIQGTPNHRVQILDEGFSLRWVPLHDVRAGQYLVVSRKEQWLGEGRELLPHKDCSRAVLPTKMTRELARLLGYWIANGSFSIYGRLTISTNNRQVRDDFVQCLAKVFPTVNTRIIKPRAGKAGAVLASSNPVYEFLQQACGLTTTVSRDKIIPTVLLQGSREYLLEFLGAYTTCDAWISKNGVQYCSASKQLIDQLHIVLTYLGVVGSKTESMSYARNGTGIEREYYHIWLHRNEARHLLRQLTIRKPYRLNDGVYINQHDQVPFAQRFLSKIQAKFSVGHSWLKQGKIHSKMKAGSLLKLNKKGLTKQDFNRGQLSNVNTEILKWLDEDKFCQWQRGVNPNLFFSPIVSVDKIDRPTRVYDVCVPKGHHFIANGIVNHNTVIAASAICKLGLKTLIIASQKEWLDNFLETFVGSDKEKAFTDARPKRVGMAHKLEDFEKLDVALVTYQKFLSDKGKRLLKKIRKKFGVLIVDEIQGGSAKEFAVVLNQFHCEYRIGLSGTPERKDNRHWVLDQLFGPVFYDNKVERMTPEVKLTETAFRGPVPQSWTYMVRKLEYDPARLKLIAKQAIKDMNDGHLVLIPMARVDPINALTKAINIMAGKKVARPFHGKCPKEHRRETIVRAREYKTKIIPGMSRLLSTGINIPRASMLYEVSPSSNVPKAEQRFSRILTPFKDKPTPVIRYFIDDFDLRRACIRNEFFQCLWPRFRPKLGEKVKERFYAYLQEKSEKPGGRRGQSGRGKPGHQSSVYTGGVL